MREKDFNIDHVLHNIKERLRERETTLTDADEDDVLELTNVVNIGSESHIPLGLSKEQDNQLYDRINNASINDELKNVIDASNSQIDQEKLEFLIRRELNRSFKSWSEKNLKHLVKDLVHKEIIRMLREAD